MKCEYCWNAAELDRNWCSAFHGMCDKRMPPYTGYPGGA